MTVVRLCIYCNRYYLTDKYYSECCPECNHRWKKEVEDGNKD
jgi:uncharacterized Zn ribbon protein